MSMKLNKLFEKYLWSVPVLLGFLLRIFDLTRSSIWHDEGYTMWLLRYNIPEIISRTARDVHPPGYYLIAKPWVSIFGNSVFSIRLLSLLFSVGIIYLTYKIVEMVWKKRAAFWSSMFVAFSPFLIRFGQEARMYGVVAFFTTLATYYLIRFVTEKRNIYLIPFTLAMIVAMYTQYYSFFVIISMWVIYAVYTPEFWKFHWLRSIKSASGVFNWRWWLANVVLLVMYLPWFPVAYKQVTRVGGSYWIKPEWITARTVPGSVSQFITYTHMDKIFYWNGAVGASAYWLIISILIGCGLLLLVNKEKRILVTSLYIFGYLPMILVFTLSKLRTPIYQDRYFPFSAIAIFIIWGCVVSLIENKKIRIALATSFLLVMCFGIYAMRIDVNHQMRQLIDEVKAESKNSDIIVSGSLYTYLDGSYYYDYQDIKLLSEGVDGYGETSLFYDQTDTYLLNPNRLKQVDSRVWVLGRNNENYATNTPLYNWRVEKTLNRGNLQATLYTR